jgi:hypothetical protein
MKKSILPIIAFTSVLLMSSCTKQGCIDSTAANYNSKANSSDNSCIYEEKLILWQSQTSAQDWLSTDVTVLKYYVDGQYVGSHAASEYTTAAPTCTSGASQLNTTISLGSSKTKIIQLEAKDQDNVSIGVESVTITAGTCNIIEL